MPRKQDNTDPSKQLDMLKDRYSKLHEQTMKSVKSNKSLQAAMKSQKKITDAVNKSSKTQISALKGQAKFANQTVKAYKASERTMRRTIKTQEKMFRAEKKLMRQRERIARMSRRGGGAAGGFGGLGLGSIAGLGLVYGALRKIQSLAERQIQAAVVAGVPSVTALRRNLPSGVTSSRALGLLGSLQQSSTLRYGTQGVPEATAKLAESVRGLGDVGTDLAGQFVQSLEPAMQRAFILAVNAKGVQSAVREFATGQNIGLATSLMNAGQLAGGQTGEPLIDAAVSTQKAFDSLNASIEKVIGTLADKLAPAVEKLAGIVEGASPGQLGLAAGGALALGIGGKGALKLGGKGLAAGGRAALPALANPFTAAAAVGTAGAYGIDWLAHGKSLHSEIADVGRAKGRVLKQSGILGKTGNRRNELQAALAKYATKHERGVFKQFFGADSFSDADKKVIEDYRNQIANLTATTTKAAKTEHQLATERKESDRISNLQAASAAREIFAPKIGLAGAATGLAGEMIRSSFLAPYRDMQVPLNPKQQAWQDKLLAQVSLLEQDLAKIDVNTDGGRVESAKVKTEIQGLRNDSASQRQASFNLQMSDYSDKLNVMRMQFQIARTTPVGIIGGMKESAALQKGLLSEINRIKGLITEQRQIDTPESLREARRLQQISLGMQAEIRGLRIKEMQYLIDSFVSQAMQTMNFSKIVIDQNQNLGMGLARGMVQARPYITGSLTPSGARPVTTQQYIRQQAQATGISTRGIVSPVHAAVGRADDLVQVAKARLEILKAERQLANKEVGLLEELLGAEPEGVSVASSPALSGGRILNTG